MSQLSLEHQDILHQSLEQTNYSMNDVHIPNKYIQEASIYKSHSDRPIHRHHSSASSDVDLRLEL